MSVRSARDRRPTRGRPPPSRGRIGRGIPTPAFVFDLRTGTEEHRSGFHVVLLSALVRGLVQDHLAGRLHLARRPFDVVVVPARPSDLRHAADVAATCDRIDLDDRTESFGRRMTDWQLLFPRLTLVVGRGDEDRLMEIFLDGGPLQAVPSAIRRWSPPSPR